MRPGRILIIEDDARLAAMVAEYLTGAGYHAQVAASGEAGLALLAGGPSQVPSQVPLQVPSQVPFDALVLDLMLPDIDGLEVCRRLRADAGGANAELPILMLTARGDATDRIVGLELGADDYLPKPFEPRELLARLRAVLRRRPGGRGQGAEVLRFGRLEIDRGGREVRVDGEARALTAYQYALLSALASYPGRVLSREAIMDLVKGETLEAFDRSIDVHISRIRQAIEDDPKHPRRIITVRGAGYVFAKAQA